MAKMRYHIGQFLKLKKGHTDHFVNQGEYVCITLAFRLKDKPNEWIYKLETRKDLFNPYTPLSTALQNLAPINPNRIIYDPIRDSQDKRYREITYNDYHHGDSCSKTTKELIQHFDVISSGEVS
jgi:hypothetical protein